MSKTRRKLPPTPTNPATAQSGPDAAEVVPSARLAHRSAAPDGDGQDELEDQEPGSPEPEYLINGTGCRRGHEPGQELIEPRLGRVPSKKITRIGVGLILWAMLGMAFLPNTNLLLLAVLLSVLWLAFSGVVQRRSGHRGHCWRTRAWRYAWGGLVPLPRLDPTREA